MNSPCQRKMISVKITLQKSNGCDTSKILYEVSKIDRGKMLRILRILEDSGDSQGIPADSWGFLRIPKDSWGFLMTLWSRDHGDSRDSVGFCRNPWGFSRILWVSWKSVRGFWSVEPLENRNKLLLCSTPFQSIYVQQNLNQFPWALTLLILGFSMLHKTGGGCIYAPPI